MTPSLAVLTIRRWNTDPLMANVVRGRTLVARELEGGIVVSWREGEKIRVYPITSKTILNEGWTDPLTDLLELLEASSLDRVEGEP